MTTVTPWLDLLEPLEAAHRFTGLKAEEVPAAAPSVDLEALQAEAEAVLESARAEAAELVEDARIQAESLREAAWQEGFHAGKLEARAAVAADLRAEWNVRSQELRTELDSIISQFAAAREELWQRQEPEMVGLAFDIARQVVKAEIKQNPEVVRHVITNAIRRLTDKENVRIRVSVSDAPHVKKMRQDLLEIVDGLRHLEINDDRRVGEGGCVIETNAGTIDAKIETQVAEVARVLGVSENE